MCELSKYKKYTQTDSCLREKEDFTYTLFQTLDFSKDKSPISFFRSDFRGAKFMDVVFSMNNLDRADFITCTFLDCKLLNVNIAACEIKNCYFKNVLFTKNQYNNTSIQECTFYDCEFSDENLLVNMKNCIFIKCRLTNCMFERSTTEKIDFENCVFFSVDLANMHAERFTFKACTLERVDIDVCYILGYLFVKTNIFDINIIYMGNMVAFTKDNVLNKLASGLWEHRRYYEFINANIMFKNLDIVPQLVAKAFDDLSQVSTHVRRLEILNIFDMLYFYEMSNIFGFGVVKKILEFFNEYDWEVFGFEEKILYITQTQKMKLYLSECGYDKGFIESANGDIAFVTFYCNTDDYNQAIQTIKQCIHDVCISHGFIDQYEVIDKHKGSWVITVAVIASCALLLPKLIKEYVDVFIEVDTKKRINKKIVEKLKKTNLKTEELKMLSEIASSSGLVHKNEVKTDLTDITKILEMIKVGI